MAQTLDEARADGAKPYAVAQVARAHREALELLLRLPAPVSESAFDVLLAEMANPTRIDPWAP